MNWERSHSVNLACAPESTARTQGLRHVTYSEVGNLENTTSLFSSFYAGFVGVAVVIITDY